MHTLHCVPVISTPLLSLRRALFGARRTLVVVVLRNVLMHARMGEPNNIDSSFLALDAVYTKTWV